MLHTASKTALLGACLLAVSTWAHAEDADFEEHGAHVHGVAQLSVAQDGDTLEMEFVSPAMNIVGFEHPATANAELDAMASALATLRDPGLVFELPAAAGCTPQSVEVGSDTGHDEHAHAGEHDVQEAAHHGEEGGHSDIVGHYRFLCADMQRLDHIRVSVFKLFPGTRVIQVQSATERGQRETELTPENDILDL